MSTPIKTPAGEILAIRLPKEDTEIEVLNDEQILIYTTPEQQKGDDLVPVYLPEGNWKLLGPISHKGEFGFDPHEYIDQSDFEAVGEDELCEFAQYCKNKFISLIESQGEILWSNPMGEKPVFDGRYDVVSERYGEMEALRSYEQDAKKWQSYEDRRVKETEQAVCLIKQ